MSTTRVTSLKGEEIVFRNEVSASGGMKDIHFHPDRKYVVGFFRDVSDQKALRDRLSDITTRYRENLLDQPSGPFWEKHFCWPFDVVEHDGKIGVVAPFYDKAFFFEHGSNNGDKFKIKGRDKEGKWFVGSLRDRHLDPREKGTWLTYFQICLAMARALRRLHMAGLSHSDLSYKNVLLDPTSGRACLIDLDGLVVPDKHAPDVVGTPDFIAPEVVATQHLDRDDPNRKLPSQATDRHALAVLIYLYLFFRHPLRGRKIHDPDPDKDETLSMGSGALFVEHPSDASNRVRVDDLHPSALPWGDPGQRPFTMAGPHLETLFRRAFIDGLHHPEKRPSPSDWETALVRTLDMIQPCSAGCEMGWYVFDNTRKPACPHCGAPHKGSLPVLNLYSSRQKGRFHSDDHRVMVWNGQSLFPWHANRKIFPNEHLEDDQKSRVGYFQEHQGTWYLVNEALPGMKDVTSGKDIPLKGHVTLTDGAQILLDQDEGGRLVQVQIAG